MMKALFRLAAVRDTKQAGELRGDTVQFIWHASSRTYVISRGKVSVRPLPNADFLSSEWFMMPSEGQPFSFGKKKI